MNTLGRKKENQRLLTEMKNIFVLLHTLCIMYSSMHKFYKCGDWWAYLVAIFSNELAGTVK